MENQTNILEKIAEGQPVVGVAMQLADDGKSFTIDQRYLDFLANAGAGYHLIEPTVDSNHLLSELNKVDGLLIPGGNDINYQLYDGVPCIGTMCDSPVPVRDVAEPILIEAAIRANMPILGICRGMQMLNVALGGDLCQIMPGVGLNHTLTDKSKFAHAVDVVPRTLLDDIVGDKSFQVNSVHHNRVDVVAHDLVVCATAPDGVIESIYYPGKKFVLGVQWHPEWLPDEYESKAIAEAFVEACKKS